MTPAWLCRATLLAPLFAACALHEPAPPDPAAGWMGKGGSLQMTHARGRYWELSVVGRDLVIEVDRRRLVCEGIVAAGGVSFWIHDEELPSVHVRSGRLRGRWEGTTLELGGHHYAFVREGRYRVAPSGVLVYLGPWEDAE